MMSLSGLGIRKWVNTESKAKHAEENDKFLRILQEIKENQHILTTRDTSGTLLSSFPKDQGKATQRNWVLEGEKNRNREGKAGSPGEGTQGSKCMEGGPLGCPVCLQCKWEHLKRCTGLNNVPQIHVRLEPQNLTLFRKSIFTNVISYDEVILD